MSPCRSPRGFTLIELIVVISIMIVLMSLIVPPAAQISGGISVTSAGSSLESQLSLARQTAISLNRSVEIRCYEISDKQGGAVAFRAFQIWVYDESGVKATALDKIQLLPQDIVMDAQNNSGGQASTAWSSTLIDFAPNNGTQNIPSIGTTDHAYRAFRYRGNGSTNLNQKGPGGTGSNTWYYTLRSSRDTGSGAQLPKNYITIQVDPFTGDTRSFRP